MLSTIEQEYIKQAIKNSVPTEEIMSVVAKKNKTKQKEVAALMEVIKKAEPKQPSMVENATIHKTVNGKDGVTVLTPQAAEMGEELSKKLTKPKTKYSDCMTTLR